MNWNSKSIDAVVMASGVNRIPLFEGYVPGYKALIPFHGRNSIEYVLDALEGVPAVKRICIVGPKDLLQDALDSRMSPRKLEFEQGGETLLDSMMAGLRHFQSSSAVLVISADLPLITPSAITDFLTAAATLTTDYDQNLYVSVAPKECYTGPYTGFSKGFNRFRDITLCHGNLFIADPRLAANHAATERVNSLYRGRKNALTSALALGLRITIAYMLGVELLHIVSLRQMARIASYRFGFGIIPVVVNHPEIAIDVDEPNDYEFVRDLLDHKQVLAAA